MVKSQVPNPKSQTNPNFQLPKFQTRIGMGMGRFWLLVIVWNLVLGAWNLNLFAQESELEFNLDVNSDTIALPKIFKPNIDLSGRGFHRLSTWPRTLAAQEVLEIWEKEIGFAGIYRLQYNLWEIQQLAKAKDAQANLLRNYENIIKKISAAGGIVILDIFGTPPGLGKVLDKRSLPLNLKALKELVKRDIKNLSCEKRYNIWYEVWSAPDLDSFFLGQQQEYLNLYKVVAEAIKELETETKMHLPLGGPAVSWWFQNLNGNTIVSPERSLIYALIKFCYRQRLPLNFITWHAYTTDPRAEQEMSIYQKSHVALIRDWLSYFNFSPDIPLIVDEWNYDRGANVALERSQEAHICASYILSRLKNMFEAGIDFQLYFSLEDFQNNPEGVTRNVGIFEFDSQSPEYKGSPKSIYNVFRMLTKLGDKMFVAPKLNDEFAGLLCTKTQDELVLLIYNYIDAEIFKNYLSRNIATLKPGERKTLLNLAKTDKLEKIREHHLNLNTLRLTKRLKGLLNKALELNALAQRFMATSRNIKLGIKNLKENYLYHRYTIDSSCQLNCEFMPVEEKEISASGLYQETLTLNPYSVNLIILKRKPEKAEVMSVLPQSQEQPISPNATQLTD